MKTILVTGSTDGIGKLTALKLAKEGHHLFLHGRNSAKLAKSITDIKSATGNDRVSGVVADFSDLDSVKRMAESIRAEVQHLDVLINNAGVFKSPIQNNKNGIDLRLVVNYLAPVVLTRKLLPLLLKSNEARIVNLSSAAQSDVDLEALAGGKELMAQTAYAQSKLALTMWSFDLAKKESKLNVIAVNPGSLLNTKMANEAYGEYWAPADKGANILFDLAVSEKYAGSTGLYFDNDNGNFATAHANAYDESKINELLKVTDSILIGLLK